MENSIRKMGISLITLIITIIVVIVLSTAVILTISKNNPIGEANKARLQTDMVEFMDALNMYHMKNSAETLGVYDSSKLSADENGITYTGEGQVNTAGNIYTIFPNLKGTYNNKIYVEKGNIIFVGDTTEELGWARDAGVNVDVFTIDENGVLKSANATLALVENSGRLMVPEGVTAIDSGAFHDVSNLKEIVIPSTVTKINAYTFSSNPTLEKVTFEQDGVNGVKIIGDFAFENCTALKEIILPDTLTSLGSTVFRGCKSLSTLSLSNSLTVLPYRMVSGCSALKNITIPESVTTISQSFENCTGLTNIYIPKNVSNLSSSAFLGCKNLNNISIDSGNNYYTIENKMLYNKDKTILLFSFTNNTSVIFPETLKTISRYAFYNCYGIPSTINIPSSVTSISNEAFTNSTITKIDVASENMNYSSENGELYNKNKTRLMFVVSSEPTYIVKEGVETICTRTFQKSNAIKEIILPESLKTLEGWSLPDLNGVSRLNIPKNLTTLSTSALPNNLSELTVDSENIVFKAENNMIFSKDGKRLIRVLRKLTDITVPEGIEVLETSSFYNSRITNVNLPNTLTKINSNSFEICSNLSSIEIPSSITNISGTAFNSCNILSSIVIHKSEGSILGSPWSCPYGERAIIWDD